MPKPNMSGALWGLTEELQFALLRKAIIDHQLVATNDIVVRFQGDLQFDEDLKVVPLREGQRQWKTGRLRTKQALPPDSVVAERNGTQYLVMGLGDWESSGFWSYRLWETPPQSAPAAPYATGQREPILVVADILQHNLGLPGDAVVVPYEQNLIPPTTGLYVSLSYVGPAKCIANGNEFDPETEEEIQSATFSHLVQIDLLSYDASARRRKEEAAMALTSIFAVQQMERYTLSLARNPSPFIDASSLEPTKRLNRFISTIVVFAVHQKVVADAPFFDVFPGQITEGGPLVSFTPAAIMET